MAVSVESLGDVAVVIHQGNFFGGKQTDELERTFRDLQSKENMKMVLDLGRVSHLNSITIGELVRAHTNYQKRGGRIIICNVDRRISNVFVITKLSLVFEVANTREEALAALGA